MTAMTSLSKRDWLLLLLSEKPLDRIRLMKALFLIWHRSGRKLPDFFTFKPYLYGPYSLELYEELEKAQNERLITQAPHLISRWASYFLTEKGRATAENIRQHADRKVIQMIRSVAEEVSSLEFYELLRRVYAEAPDFASKSLVRTA